MTAVTDLQLLAYLSGDLSPADELSLEAELIQNEEVQLRLSELVRVSSVMSAVNTKSEQQSSSLALNELPGHPVVSLKRSTAWISVAAIFALGLGIGLVINQGGLLPTDTPLDLSVASVDSSEDEMQRAASIAVNWSRLQLETAQEAGANQVEEEIGLFESDVDPTFDVAVPAWMIAAMTLSETEQTPEIESGTPAETEAL